MESIQQIWKAVMQLTTAELLRLRLYARWRINAIGRTALGRDGRDLLEEAIIATAVGDRPWKSGIDLRAVLDACFQVVILIFLNPR